MLEAENERITRRIAANNVRRHVVDGDGDCLFAATSVSVYHTVSHKHELRQAAVNWIREHRHDFEAAGAALIWAEAGVDSWDAYLLKMARPGVYGDELCMAALQQCLRRRFINLLSDEGQRNDTPVEYKSGGRTSPDWPVVHLLYVSRARLNLSPHYDCLFPIADK